MDGKLFTDLYIDGAWRPATGDARAAVHDPADGSVIAEVAVAGIADCLAAVEAAEAAQAGWAATAPRRRSEILRRAYEIMRDERETIAGLIVRENGKVLADARSEADYAAEFFRWFAEEAVRIGGDFRVAPNGDKRIVVTRQPIGVSVLVTPWNFPAAMATRKIGPALAAGCCVVLKPAFETPLTALYLVDVLERAGVPAGVVNCVTPRPAGPAVSAMLHHPAVRKLSFTGSTEVGRILLHEAADRVVSTSMELGGNAPFLVFDDAPVADAVAAAMVAKMRNGGAACTAANRFYVQRGIAEAFTKALAAEMSALAVGPGADPANGLGASVSVGERDKIAELVDEAVAGGARAETGGGPIAGPGAFYPATVLTGVQHGTPITRTEIFGPVAPIVVFDSEQEAIDWANDTEYGLIAYVYSGDLARAIRVGERLDAGMVAVNRGVLSDPAAPFGGVKQSGLGREGGSEGIEEFLEQKYLAVPL
ncbi:NAD-dependent succinate-semialdehyde dehydrogenase [Planosporangium mesophilum]|uniref:NAD-dependent succinate-semialdehyde dehydrogenase n=1 Tax=Planosporangium mesophilum TaxID=689768 RepID=A0A8J3TE29_9ACTN|nr:NAD-dependent succinate-semialdehyde dehydrogenase [Planosporangium mesophilum]NJC82968.1 NAD-dependent succinate-semialdehyde dehydrogenase [Planosporangium mesophilum]GII24748.1 NAD-dependent succinate-semialdehyde dehydrogenase [Planosporangium mesophilum]